MLKKLCKKCKEIKDISDFYVAQRVCKECTKLRVRKREKYLKKTNPEWVEKERKRCRERNVRLGYVNKYRPTTEKRMEYQKRYRRKYSEKYMAQNAVQHFYCEEGNHLHHWSYNKEHHKDVIEITARQHYNLHLGIIYDQKAMMYRDRKTGLLLDTRQSHVARICGDEEAA